MARIYPYFSSSLRSASMAFRRHRIDWTVDDTSVEGFGNTFVANQIVGKYSGTIALRSGAFDVSLFAVFTGYLKDPTLVLSQLDASGGNLQGYGLYAAITASGPLQGTGGNADPFRMTFSQADVRVFLDPQQDTTKALPGAAGSPVVLGQNGDDLEALAGTYVIPSESIGFSIPGFGGNFLLVFDQPMTTTRGAAYWPGLPGGLRALIKGDFDNWDPLAGTIAGDVLMEFWFDLWAALFSGRLS